MNFFIDHTLSLKVFSRVFVFLVVQFSRCLFVIRSCRTTHSLYHIFSHLSSLFQNFLRFFSEAFFLAFVRYFLSYHIFFFLSSPFQNFFQEFFPSFSLSCGTYQYITFCRFCQDLLWYFLLSVFLPFKQNSVLSPEVFAPLSFGLLWGVALADSLIIIACYAPFVK